MRLLRIGILIAAGAATITLAGCGSNRNATRETGVENGNPPPPSPPPDNAVQSSENPSAASEPKSTSATPQPGAAAKQPAPANTTH